MPNETTRLERARAFESNHGCGSIGGCSICLCDFATQECAALEKQYEALDYLYADLKKENESLTAQLAEAREAFDTVLDCDMGRQCDLCKALIRQMGRKLKAAIEAAGVKEQ